MSERAEIQAQTNSRTLSLLDRARVLETKIDDYDPAQHNPPEELSKLAFQPHGIEIHSAEDLLGVGWILDCLICVGLRNTDGFSSLKEMARAYLRSNPVLLTVPWIHGGGTVFDMHRELTGGHFDGALPGSNAVVH